MDQLKGLIKGLLEKLMLEKRELYLREHPTKANGYYIRDLITLFGPLEDLKVPQLSTPSFSPTADAPPANFRKRS